MELKTSKEDKLTGMGALGGMIILFLSILLPPPWETSSEVYIRLLCMSIPWFFFIFVIAPKIMSDDERPNFWDSGEGISKEKIMTLIELLTKMESMRRSTKDPVVLALIKKTEQRYYAINELTKKGKITLQQSLDDQLEILREGNALMSILEEETQQWK